MVAYILIYLTGLALSYGVSSEAKYGVAKTIFLALTSWGHVIVYLIKFIIESELEERKNNLTE